MLERAITHADLSRLGLLLDIRDGPIRNDAPFEQAVRPYQEAVTKRFARVAVLVKTPVGKLQAGRVMRSIEHGPRVFIDEREAIAFLDARDDD